MATNNPLLRAESPDALIRSQMIAQLGTRSDAGPMDRSGLFYQTFPNCVKGCKPKSTKRSDHKGLCRVLYRKHSAFMRAGARHHERLFLASNQSGKTRTAAVELVCHLTGEYPAWWEGYRFRHPIEAWAAGDTRETTRDIIQVELMGPIEHVERRQWSGMFPAHAVYETTRKSGGVPWCLDYIWIRHLSGGLSSLQLKAYDQGRRAFQGTKKSLIWLDEEPPDEPAEAESESNDIYTECLMRTVNTGGLLMATFTPLRGMTRFLQGYLDSAVMDGTGTVEVPARKAFAGVAV